MKRVLKFLMISFSLIANEVSAQENYDTIKLDFVGKLIVIDSLSNIAPTIHYYNSKYLLLCEPDSNINKCLGNKRMVLTYIGNTIPGYVIEGNNYKFNVSILNINYDDSIDYKLKKRSPCFSYILQEDNQKIYLINRIEQHSVFPTESYSCIDNRCISYYKSGKIKSVGNISKGAPNGKWVFYNELGEITEKGRMKNGKRTGIWRIYKSDGTFEKKEY